MDSAIRIRHLGSDTRLFGSVRDSIAQSARKFAIFRNICTTFSQIWCDLRGFNRAKREKICNLGPSGAYSPPFAPTSSLRPLRKGPPLRFSALPQNPRRRGPGPPPVSATGGARGPRSPPLVSAPGLLGRGAAGCGFREIPSFRPSVLPSGRRTSNTNATELKLGPRGYQGRRLRFKYGELAGNSSKPVNLTFQSQILR